MRGAIATAACLLCAASAAAQDDAAHGPLRLIDVPYVSQSELLCGGAAAAMLMRHAGLRGIYAEDFSSLVDESAGGIAAADLRRALVTRGFDARASSGSPEIAGGHLASGRPVMALVEDRPGRFHYVVIVGWHDGAVVYHDPARAPFMASSEAAFDRAWSASGRWMLVARATPAALADRAGPSSPAEPAPAAADGDRAAALRAFEAADYRAAMRLAVGAIDRDPEDVPAWRLLAASRYLSGDAGGALDAWNRAGEPRIDLVRLDGLVRTPHRTVERLMGLPPRAVLTRDALARASRRLALLPSRQASNVSYVALPAGLAEVRGAIVERPLLPSRGEWLLEAARLPIDRGIDVPFANLARAGDRLTATWRLREGQPRAGVAFQFPGRGGRGVWSLRGAWQQERYAAAGAAAEASATAEGGHHSSTVQTSERREAGVEWTDWMSGRVRLIAAAGVARWERLPQATHVPNQNSYPAATGRAVRQETAALSSGGIELRPIGDRLAASLRVSVAGGGVSFATASADARWRLPFSDTLRALGTGSVGHASRSTPPDAWFGAGAGHARPLLLRAHHLFNEGAIAGSAFGRTIAQASIELQRDVFARGLFSIGVAGFADAARAWRRTDQSSSPFHVDAGVGLRLRLAPGRPAIRLDWARGLRDGEAAFSAGWQAWGSY